jgi:hypothetical protein
VARDTSFYYSFLVAPRGQARRDRRRVGLLPRGGRRGGRARQHASPREALAEWRRELERCYAGQPQHDTGDPPAALDSALRPAAPGLRGADRRRRDGPRARTRYETFDELYDYCWHVASTVGLICVEIFGYRRPETREYAVDLGIALQLTNITRDVAGPPAAASTCRRTTSRRFGCTEATSGPDASPRARAGAAGPPVRPRARLLRARARARSRARTPGRSWRPRSWAPSTATCCGASSARATTCSTAPSACRVPGAPSSRPRSGLQTMVGWRAAS